MLDDITPVILSYNEAPNIARTLTALTWANRIVVVDSHSDDKTREICAQFNNVDFIQRPFDQHAVQWNFAINQGIGSNWVLALDADHVLSDTLIQELAALKPDSSTNGYWSSFTYKIRGRKLHGSLYPPLIALYRTGLGNYTQDGHTQRVNVPGNIGALHNKTYHDDRKPWSRWLESQKKYAAQEAAKLSSETWGNLSWPDRLRVLGVAPLAVLPYTLIVKKLIWSGLPGLEYCWQRLIAELYLQKARFTQNK